jgi:hypothetical protein
MLIHKNELLFASLHNQHLLKKAPCKKVVSDLCGLQSQFANNPKYALRIRGSDFDEKHWKEGLVKTWTLRGTLHVILEKELGLFLSAQGLPEEWHNAWGLEAGRLRYWVDFIMEQISEGVCRREAIKEQCREKGISAEEEGKVFHGWGGVLYEMSRRGLIAYQCGTAKEFVPCENIQWLESDEARAILLRRYFQAFGPASIEDCVYFTGYKRRDISALMSRFEISSQSVSLEGKDYFYIGTLPSAGDIPPCVYLAGFDQLVMGYRDRSRIMEEQFKPAVTTNSGIVHPTILLKGRLQAKWKKDGKRLVITPFTALSSGDKQMISETGENLFAGEIQEISFQREFDGIPR